MIRPLRQRHRRMVIAVGIFLPIAFAAGIAARKTVPATASLPAGLATSSQKFAVTKWERSDMFVKIPIQVRLMVENADGVLLAVEFSAAKDFVKPDLIVYWVAGNPAITDTLPDNAILLGSFSSMPLALSDEVAKSNGQLVLFSLADNEIVDVSKPIRFNDSTK